MGCLNNRKEHEVRPEAKWDYISLRDFRSSSCFTVFAYCYVWFSLFLSIAVYAVDSFTAVNLLAFDRWSSSITPTQIIPFSVAKWIFSGCIIASFVNLAFEHIRARRVMNRGSVAECYLDNLAVRMESLRVGKGQGWRRFLVFAELTKSKKGAEYVALFTYFNFQSWIRTIFCSGPRQAVNALTLLSVYKAALLIDDTSSVENSIMNFFEKLRQLATEEPNGNQQAVILSGMLFTLVIWVFSALGLLISALFYVFFLWHHIPRDDGGLSGYCGRKINKRLMRIVQVKINKGLARQEQQRLKAEAKAALKAGEKAPLGSRQATLPDVMSGKGSDDKLPEMPQLQRMDTMATLPVYTSRPSTPQGFELNNLNQTRPMPGRSATNMTTASSAPSYTSNAPLLGSAAGMGYERSASPAPSLPPVDLNNYPPARPGTASSNRGFPPGPGQLSRVPTNQSSLRQAFTASPATYSSEQIPRLPPPSRPQPGTMDSYGRSSPAPSAMSNRGISSPRGPPGQYNPYAPMRSATNPTLPVSSPPYAPQRNMTAPMPRGPGSGDYGPRPGTSNSQRSMPRPGYGGNGYNADLERGGPRY